ncbi:DUF3576 domain-containing protein [Jannaschia sp. W003]|uniref:DUF3576 domain-containing protein n=1 Tax=Jannaschia sp. W003 TaxID=2867012 RepID=UPI0021A881D6|nr:DUF3576 domain-containing protein [Jannaschia sp. W003]UWQ22128.1 DUF3576 domain-containing protein [Jannaschia sp. W003]
MASTGTLAKAARLSVLASAVALAGCDTVGPFRLGQRAAAEAAGTPAASRRSSVFDLFENRDDPNVTLEVNRYLWAATLDVLGFLPVRQADPFGGVIEFGYGTPPGGGRAYAATVLIQDPALDARSLKLSMRTRSGAVDRGTLREIENAILTRARQLRIRDSRL